MATTFLEKRERLADPVATTGDQLYLICSQNGLFPTPWATNHVPHELWGVWAHPIKLLDGFWLALHNRTQGGSAGITSWLLEADACRVYGTHTEFTYRVDELTVTRRDFVPDGLMGLVVTVTVQLPASFTDELALVVLVRSDLRPAWLGEQVGLHDAPDQVEVVNAQRHIRFVDQANPWVALVGGDSPLQSVQLQKQAGVVQPTVGTGATARFHVTLTKPSANTMTATLYIAGATTGEAAALATYTRLRADYRTLVQRKAALYERLSQTTQVTTPDPGLNQAFHWAKLTGQMLARQSPTHGPALGAGLPNYPWWFGIDTEYAVLPMVQGGLFDLTKTTLRLLKSVSETHNTTEPGRVIHELSTTGVVYNPGNLVETPAFTRAVYQAWRWTGDRAFLAEMYPFCKAGLLDYTLGHCDPDGDLCPAGRSIIETLEMHADFECIDIASYTWEALTHLAELAGVLGDTATQAVATSSATTLAERIRQEWWLESEGLFADVRATTQQVRDALQRIDDLESDPGWPWMKPQAEQAHRLLDDQLQARRTSAQDVDLPWLLRHWVVMCPAEVGLATEEQAARTFARLLSPEFCNEWGMMLHPDRPDAMSINTGLLALALVRYGRIDDALRLIQPMATTLIRHMPGAISEALPDQWCFLQLWSALGIISPIIEGVLGINPNAGAQTLQVIPHLPTHWPTVTVEELQVGEATFTIQVFRTATQYRLQVRQNQGQHYHLQVGFYLPTAVTVTAVQLNGSPVPWHGETTLAGRRLYCKSTEPADLIVTVVT
ncbi:MAG: hypothetical protein KF832_02315 [Caldilineaceae bacterium]|nr:hypothetical protein [Caldilineaceae bacterium]